ncbi:3-oxoacyl-[acyl-carrier protein] reductase [Pseudomonas koreensis]|nr:3-oxoacyl-[acyl-carrier protein] reductase [Pseudomonas koreensis]
MLMCNLAVTGKDRASPITKTTQTGYRGMRMQLNDKVIIITGGCQGLGRSMAEYFAGKGAKLALVDLNQEKLDDAVAACKAKGVEARSYLCNVANEEQVEHMVAQVAEDFGAIHGLINNAGILRDGLLLKVKDGEMTKMSLAQWQAVIDVNLTGVFLCTREVAAKMIELKNSGAIINISSISRAGNVGQTNYSAAKAGVAAATVTWAKELARYGIRVAGIAPGFIETEMTLGMKPEALEKMTSGIPLKRMGKPEEIAHSAAYIFENDYYTGRILEMDGGLRI